MSDQMSFWGYDADGLETATGKRLVYFVECRGQIKIGFTTRDVRERIKEFATGNPDECKLLGAIAVQEGRDDRYFHQQFAVFRRRGEWFEKTPEFMAAVDRLLRAERRRKKRDLAPIDIKCEFSELEQPKDYCISVDCPACQKWLCAFVTIIVHFIGTRPNAFYLWCDRCEARVPINLAFIQKDKAA